MQKLLSYFALLSIPRAVAQKKDTECAKGPVWAKIIELYKTLRNMRTTYRDWATLTELLHKWNIYK